MRRRLFNIVAAISLLLCILAVAAWGWSHTLGAERWNCDVVTMAREYKASVSPGRVYVAVFGGVRRGDGIAASPGTRFNTQYSKPLPVVWGIAYNASPAGAAYQRAYLVPLHLLVWATLVMPAVWLLLACHNRRVARRAKRGMCASCGYDLRATPDRCPECGAVPAKAGP